MERITFKYLSQEDIIDLRISHDKVMEIAENVMEANAKGLCQCPPKPGIYTRERSFLHAMPAYVESLDVCGIKWVCGYPANRGKGLPVTNGLLIYNDAETGLPLAVMDCRWITAVRTAAVGAVTAKYCKVSVTETMTIIGAGVQSRWNLLMIKAQIPELRRCYINDINEDILKTYIEDMKERLPEVELIPVKSEEIKDSIAKSQIVFTATQNLPKPIVTKDMLHPGMLGIAFEGKAWEDSIYIESIDRFVCDDWALVESYRKKGSFGLGLPAEHTLLGDIINGSAAGRTKDDEIVMAFNMGMSITDIALADVIYKEAVQKNIGIELVLMEKEDLM